MAKCKVEEGTERTNKEGTEESLKEGATALLGLFVLNI